MMFRRLRARGRCCEMLRRSCWCRVNALSVEQQDKPYNNKKSLCLSSCFACPRRASVQCDCVPLACEPPPLACLFVIIQKAGRFIVDFFLGSTCPLLLIDGRPPALTHYRRPPLAVRLAKALKYSPPLTSTRPPCPHTPTQPGTRGEEKQARHNQEATLPPRPDHSPVPPAAPAAACTPNPCSGPLAPA